MMLAFKKKQNFDFLFMLILKCKLLGNINLESTIVQEQKIGKEEFQKIFLIIYKNYVKILKCENRS